MFVVSDLVSNSVEHAAPLPGGDIIACFDVHTDALHVEIADGGAGTAQQPRVVALTSMGGRGLDLVFTVSRQWSSPRVRTRSRSG